MELGDLHSLVELDVHNNALTGTLPLSLTKLKSLFSLFLQNNMFSGELSPLFDKWARGDNCSLLTVDLSNNLFSGQLPSELFTLPSLISLAAVSCCFEGELPESLCSSSKIQSLILDGLSDGKACAHNSFLGNHFSRMRGSIPKCVYDMPSLQTVLNFVVKF